MLSLLTTKYLVALVPGDSILLTFTATVKVFLTFTHAGKTCIKFKKLKIACSIFSSM